MARVQKKDCEFMFFVLCQVLNRHGVDTSRMAFGTGVARECHIIEASEDGQSVTRISPLWPVYRDAYSGMRNMLLGLRLLERRGCCWKEGGVGMTKVVDKSSPVGID